MRLAGALHPAPFLLLPILFTARTFHFGRLRTSFCFAARTSAVAPLSTLASFLGFVASRFSGIGQTGSFLRGSVRIIWYYVKYFWGQRSAPLAAGLGLSGGGLCGSWLLSSARPARWTLFVVASRVFCARSGFCWPFVGFGVVCLSGGWTLLSCCYFLRPAAALASRLRRWGRFCDVFSAHDKKNDILSQ